MKRETSFLLAVVLSAVTAHAALLDFLKPKTNTTSTATPSLAGLSQEQVTDGLKQALSKGVQTAITNLARPGGFLSNAQVRIPMPEKLQTVEKTLRAMKQDKYANEFVTTMNRAAEQAVPQALPIFTDALKSMTIEDAKKLASGGKDSATLFFKGKGEKQIQEKMLPVVKEATAKTGVTSAYKKLLDQASGGGNSFLSKLNINTASFDVDSYVSQKASDGLFKMIAEEEKRIRENPTARTTELLQKVFGAVK
ncbi:MAG TPA: DUF4197 domain-containing protein [Methylomirabilota bacterium]|nr:DUF4197 domain-containing protein [Methylomirabilota bacterium]